ncbi:MAG: N4-gp56 family major capsid protein [Rhizobiales bacterium]|nr:N4-gp56 family major capsid protein [Hyphomicrobiales bacterium]
MKTTVPVGDPKAIKRWSAELFLDTAKKSYFERKFIGTTDNAIIQRLTDLESAAGDTITYDLSLQLRKKPVYGDDRAQGKSEELKFATDEVKIDQMRAPVSAGGRMTRKRTLHDLRRVARDRLGDYWSRFLDEMMFIYLSGARGINEDYIEDVTWVGHAGNPIQAPDATHLIFGGTATSKATIVAADKMARAVIEKAAVKAQMIRSTDPENPNMLPSNIMGEGHFVMVMTPFQEHDLRLESGAQGWLEIQKAAAAAEGRNNPIFKGSLGMINKVVLHSHESIIRFNDYGAGTDLPAARALFLGRQAGVCAYGTAGGTRFQWEEELTDFKNQVDIAAGTILGVKKTRFKNRDFGVIAIDTYAKDPNAA